MEEASIAITSSESDCELTHSNFENFDVSLCTVQMKNKFNDILFNSRS